MYQRFLLLSVLLFGVVFGGTCDTANIVCQLADGNLCSGSDSDSITLGGNSYSFSLYNAISFGDFYLSQGDVQGRLAVQGNFYAGYEKGATVGDQIKSENGDISIPYSLLVGGNSNWTAGELYPVASTNTKQEDAFVGGNNDGSATLKARVTANCNGNSGCLDSYFNTAKNFWNNWSTNIGNKAATTSYTISETKVLSINCQSSTNRLNFVSIPDSDFNTVAGYTTSGCATNAVYVVNIFGGSDVVFNGQTFSGPVGTVYNIVGSARKVSTTVYVSGTIVNPSGSIDQTEGTIVGNVIAGNILNLRQVNRPTCPTDVFPTTTAATTVSASTTNNGDDDARGSTAAQTIACFATLICLCLFAL